jgi:hypothetical protein
MVGAMPIGRSLMVAMLWAGAAQAQPPSKNEVAKLLKKTIKDVRSVSEVFADVGGGRFPILFVTQGRNCIEHNVDDEKEQSCSSTSLPHAAIVGVGSSGLTLAAQLALPTAAAPWDVPEELKWGSTQVQDWDGDGKPELLIIYGYHGPTAWAVGDTYYRELVLLNLDRLTQAVHVTLDQKPQALSNLELESNFKFAGSELTITRHAGEYDDGKGERVYRDTTQLWRRGPDDRYVEVKIDAPAGKK